ncbi:MFS transporter [Limosilactobacillus sp. RRLNB_1_1]|uniref:MFS transporter n=1 Tax=Limosilactobacillus albertensis TaxID=2759752 RepID=A0A7W3TRT0_9LACO|nr:MULTISPECIES: MFS transporter [Limosilactobacillus]MBC8744649.1 MFS transporter [Lactobacillus sp. Marseille-P7033]MRH47189.1 MFS transporter [Limosilactobacillus reuteri]MBB1069722.1 MFS transporter [Limosilactobacillus albertensis]MCD7117816.1 MFS transporter [Limosilactobacillus albertensis]MCD7124060.1 MFS transporter [Limosilactobacillus caviae]
MQNLFKNPFYRSSSLIILLFFTGWGIWWSFFQIWLTNTLGFSGAEVGTIYSFNSAVTLVLMFVYGAIQDKLGIKRTLLIICAILQMLLGPFFSWVYAPLLHSHFYLGTILGSLYLSFAFLAASPTFEALTERFSRRYGFEYGQARAWGSFGYAVAALAAGFLFTVNPNLVFWSSSAIATVLLLILLFDKPARHPEVLAKYVDKEENEKEKTGPSFKEILSVFKMKALWQIVIYIILSWTFYTVFDQQMFPQFFTQFFATKAAGQQMYGILNSAEVFLEAIMMACVPWVMKKVGVRKTLLLGIIIMVVRIGGCGLVTNPFGVSLIKLLHAPETALFALGLFRYFTLHFDTKVSATLYMVGYQIAAQVGQIIFSTPLGDLRDHIGYSHTFLVISGIVAIAGIYATFILKKDNQDVNGQPLDRD